MGFLKHTVGISRADLTRDCLREVQLWPGCETVEELGVLGDLRGRFSVHVIKYGAVKKSVGDPTTHRRRARKGCAFDH
jgi:hypothetical protein